MSYLRCPGRHDDEIPLQAIAAHYDLTLDRLAGMLISEGICPACPPERLEADSGIRVTAGVDLAESHDVQEVTVGHQKVPTREVGRCPCCEAAWWARGTMDRRYDPPVLRAGTALGPGVIGGTKGSIYGLRHRGILELVEDRAPL